MQVNNEGVITRFLEDPTGEHVAFVSAVEEHMINGHPRLFLGNIVQDYVSYLDL
jgi:hypothetical protein